LATATGVPGLNRNDVYALSILFPPATEQDRIVRILDGADQLRRLRAEADRRTADLIPALFHEMFSSDIDIKLRPSHNPLEEVCTSPAGIKAGPFGSSLKKECYTNDGPRVYGQEQIIAGDFTIGDYHVSQAKYDEMRAYSVYPGDVLISLVGTFGKVAVVPDHAEPGIINPRLIRIRVNKSMISPIFLKHYLELKETQLHLESLARGQTMGVLNATLLKELTVPVPPLDQQNSFAAHVAEIQSFEAEQAASQQRLDALFQSLLHGAFQGEL
jgi:type I restriction enzyme S subunit